MNLGNFEDDNVNNVHHLHAGEKPSQLVSSFMSSRICFPLNWLTHVSWHSSMLSYLIKNLP